MTVEELKRCDQPFISAYTAAKILQTDPEEIRLKCRSGMDVGYKYEVRGQRRPTVRISRKSFLNYLEELQVI